MNRSLTMMILTTLFLALVVSHAPLYGKIVLIAGAAYCWYGYLYWFKKAHEVRS